VTKAPPNTAQTEMSADRRDIARDERDIARDRADITADRSDIQRDRADIRTDEQDMRRDRADLPADRSDPRSGRTSGRVARNGRPAPGSGATAGAHADRDGKQRGGRKQEAAVHAARAPGVVALDQVIAGRPGLPESRRLPARPAGSGGDGCR